MFTVSSVQKIWKETDHCAHCARTVSVCCLSAVLALESVVRRIYLDWKTREEWKEKRRKASTLYRFGFCWPCAKDIICVELLRQGFIQLSTANSLTFSWKAASGALQPCVYVNAAIVTESQFTSIYWNALLAAPGDSNQKVQFNTSFCNSLKEAPPLLLFRWLISHFGANLLGLSQRGYLFHSSQDWNVSLRFQPLKCQQEKKRCTLSPSLKQTYKSFEDPGTSLIVLFQTLQTP